MFFKTSLFFYLLGIIALVNTWFSLRSICVAWEVIRDYRFHTGIKLLMLFSSIVYPLTNIFVALISFLTADNIIIPLWALTLILFGHSLLHYGLIYLFLFEEKPRNLSAITERPV